MAQINDQSREKKVIVSFFRKNALATISTVNNRMLQSESALIAFAELPTLEIVFTTRKDSRKYKNLMENQHVSLVIGWDPDPKKRATLQYEGQAALVADEDVDRFKKIFSKKKKHALHGRIPIKSCDETFQD